MKITVTPQKYKKMMKKLGQVTTSDMIREDQLTEDEIKELVGLFPDWEEDPIGFSYTPGMLRLYNDDLYEVRANQGHNKQSDWTPDVATSLWKIRSAPGVIPEWEQPEGSHDAYNTGDQVTHNGKTWESNIDGNVWEPPEQWTEVI